MNFDIGHFVFSEIISFTTVNIVKYISFISMDYAPCNSKLTGLIENSTFTRIWAVKYVESKEAQHLL